MNLSFEITDVDWSIPDVQRVIDVIGDKYVQQAKVVQTGEDDYKAGGENCRTAKYNYRITATPQTIRRINIECTKTK